MGADAGAVCVATSIRRLLSDPPQRRSTRRRSAPRAASRQIREQRESWSHADTVVRNEVLLAGGRHLPRFRSREVSSQVAERLVDGRIVPLAFDKKSWFPIFDDDEIDLPSRGIPEVTELDIATLAVLEKVRPFEKVRGDERNGSGKPPSSRRSRKALARSIPSSATENGWRRR